MMSGFSVTFAVSWACLSLALAGPLHDISSTPRALQEPESLPLPTSSNQTQPILGVGIATIRCKLPSLVPSTNLDLDQCRLILGQIDTHQHTYKPPYRHRDGKPVVLGQSPKDFPQCRMVFQKSKRSLFLPRKVELSRSDFENWFTLIQAHDCGEGGTVQDPAGALGWEYGFYHPYWDYGNMDA